jgi:hypothetical protein
VKTSLQVARHHAVTFCAATLLKNGARRYIGISIRKITYIQTRFSTAFSSFAVENSAVEKSEALA